MKKIIIIAIAMVVWSIIFYLGGRFSKELEIDNPRNQPIVKLQTEEPLSKGDTLQVLAIQADTIWVGYPDHEPLQETNLNFDLPEEWQALSTDSTKPDKLIGWKDSKSIVHIEFNN